MKAFWTAALGLLLAVSWADGQSARTYRSFAAQPKAPLLAFDSLEVSASADVPLFWYWDISNLNLGGQVRANVITPNTKWRFSVLYDGNVFALPTATVVGGFQNNLMVGAGQFGAVAVVPDLGIFSLGYGADLGVMTHYATGVWRNKTSENQFWVDPALALETEASLRFQDTPFDPFVKPRFFFAPELKNMQVYELGVLLGLRYHLGANAWKTGGFSRRVSAVQILRDGKIVQSAEALTGETIKFQAKILPQGAENKRVSWQSSNLKVAVVGTDGLVRAIGPGTAQISVVTAEANKKAVVDLKVSLNPEAWLDALDPGYWPGDSERSVTGRLTLPPQDPDGASVLWTSAVPTTVGAEGSVNRPPFGTGNKEVLLTAQITKGGRVFKHSWNLLVIEMPQADADAVAADALATAIQYQGRDRAEAVTLPVGLPTSGKNGSTITWVTSAPEVVTPEGSVFRPVFGKGDAQVQVTATIKKGNASQTVPFTLIVKENLQTDGDGVKADLDSVAPRYAQGESAQAVKSKVTLPTRGTGGSAVRWASDKPGVVATDGTVVRPLGSDQNVKLTATLTKGAASATKDFLLTVKDLAVEKDLQLVAPQYQAGDSAASVTANVTLVPTGPNGTQVKWTSANPLLLGNDGKVTRPLGADKLVKLTVVVSKGDQSATKDFNLNIRDRSVVVDAENLAIGYQPGDSAPAVTLDVSFLGSGPNGTVITWTTSDLKTVGADGQVNRPVGSDKTVVVTATVTKGDQKANRTFTLTVLDAAVDNDLATFAPTYADGDKERWVTKNVGLPTQGRNGTKGTWETTDPNTITTSGQVNRPLGKDVEVGLRVTATKGPITKTKEFSLLVKDRSVDVDTEALNPVYAPDDSADFVAVAPALPTRGANGTTITWQSDLPVVLSPTGKLTRPLGHDQPVVLTATVTKGDQSATKVFNLLVKDGTEEQIANDIASQLKANKINGITVKETRRGVTIIATDLNFPPDSARFTPEITRKVTVLANILKWIQGTSTKILVEGHAANIGDPATVLSVSQARAQAVAEFFVDKGAVAADKMTWVGKGGTVPVGDNKTEEGRIKNRRVEIVIMKVTP